MTEERRTVRDLLEQGHLESLVQWFNTQIETIENSKLLLGEALCSEMWRQLGHRNPRAILLPFLIVRLPPDILQKLAHTHITLLLIFIGEVAEEVKGESKFLKVLGVNVCTTGNKVNTFCFRLWRDSFWRLLITIVIMKRVVVDGRY